MIDVTPYAWGKARTNVRRLVSQAACGEFPARGRVWGVEQGYSHVASVIDCTSEFAFIRSQIL